MEKKSGKLFSSLDGMSGADIDTTPAARVAVGIRELFFRAILMLVAPLIVFVDVAIIGHGVPERSFTEFTQEALLLMSASIFGYSAWRYIGSRGFFVLVAGFFGCMLVRELDSLLDNVWHGFWLWPALFIATISIGYAGIACRTTILKPMANFFSTAAYHYLSFGLLVVLVFSRVFGSGALLWGNFMGPDYSGIFKSSMQEGLELFGYVFIGYGSCLFLWQKHHCFHKESANDNLIDPAECLSVARHKAPALQNAEFFRR